MKNIISIVLCLQLISAPLATAESSNQCRALFSNIPAKTLQAQAQMWGIKTVRGLLTFPLPVLPLYRSLSNGDKRWTILEKALLIGPITTAVAVSLSRAITGSEAPWVMNFLDSYISYNAKDIVGMGVALDQTLRGWQQYWINYGYTVMAYSLVTTTTSGTIRPIYDVLMRPETATTADVNGAAYGLGLVTFAFAWPLISQVINTTIVPPILAYRFPKASTLKDVKSKDQQGVFTFTNSQVMTKYRDKWQMWESKLELFEKNLTSETYYQLWGFLKTKLEHFENKNTPIFNEHNVKKLKKTIAIESKHAKDQYLWVKWIRVGLEPGDKYPFLPMTAKKQTGKLNPVTGVWAIKTLFVSLVASTLIIGYFGARDMTIGTSPEDMRIISELFFDLMNNPNGLSEIAAP